MLINLKEIYNFHKDGTAQLAVTRTRNLGNTAIM